MIIVMVIITRIKIITIINVNVKVLPVLKNMILKTFSWICEYKALAFSKITIIIIIFWLRCKTPSI